MPVEALLHRCLGKAVGARADIVQLCATRSLVRVRVRVRVGVRVRVRATTETPSLPRCAALSDGPSTGAGALRWGDEAG